MVLPKEVPPNAGAVPVAGAGTPKLPTPGALPKAGTAAEPLPKENPAVVPPPKAKLTLDPGAEAPRVDAALPNTDEVGGPPKLEVLPPKGDALLPNTFVAGRSFSLFGEVISTLACKSSSCSH